MKTINDKLQKHTLIAALLATALAGCDGQEAKAPEGTVVTPKVAESKPATPPAAPAMPNPAPADKATVVQTPSPESVKPDVVLSSDASGLLNVAKGKMATQSSDGWGGKAAMAVDGNVDGVFQHKSVSHTLEDPNAWLDVDLGNTESIDHINVWNRTDSGSGKLANYWIFISDKPFSPKDTVEKLKKVKGVTAIKGETANPLFSTPAAKIKGRYVRVQLDGSAAPKNAFLHVAEVEVYRAK
jgi:hypothetical protein